MGLFRKKPDKNVPVLPVEEVKQRLMMLNRESAPYRIIDGAPQKVDLIAEWKIVDAKWYEIFAKASLTKVFRIYMKFDPSKNEVRAKDEEYTLEWRAGVPTLSLAASKFQGQMRQGTNLRNRQSFRRMTYRLQRLGRLHPHRARLSRLPYLQLAFAHRN